MKYESTVVHTETLRGVVLAVVECAKDKVSNPKYRFSITVNGMHNQRLQKSMDKYEFIFAWTKAEGIKFCGEFREAFLKYFRNRDGNQGKFENPARTNELKEIEHKAFEKWKINLKEF